MSSTAAQLRIQRYHSGTGTSPGRRPGSCERATPGNVRTSRAVLTAASKLGLLGREGPARQRYPVAHLVREDHPAAGGTHSVTPRTTMSRTSTTPRHWRRRPDGSPNPLSRRDFRTRRSHGRARRQDPPGPGHVDEFKAAASHLRETPGCPQSSGSLCSAGVFRSRRATDPQMAFSKGLNGR